MPACEIRLRVYKKNSWETDLLLDTIINKMFNEKRNRDKFTKSDYKKACKLIGQFMLAYNNGERGNSTYTIYKLKKRYLNGD